MGLFGSSGGYNGRTKDWADDLRAQLQNMAGMYDPMQDVALSMEGYDDALRGQQQALGNDLMNRGFRGNPSLGLGRAAFAATTRSNARQKKRDWDVDAMQAQASFLPSYAQINYKQPSSGILGSLGALAANYFGGGGMNPKPVGTGGIIPGPVGGAMGGAIGAGVGASMGGLAGVGAMGIDWKRLLEQRYGGVG